jgi:hypothetical protein
MDITLPALLGNEPIGTHKPMCDLLRHESIRPFIFFTFEKAQSPSHVSNSLSLFTLLAFLMSHLNEFELASLDHGQRKSAESWPRGVGTLNKEF